MQTGTQRRGRFDVNRTRSDQEFAADNSFSSQTNTADGRDCDRNPGILDSRTKTLRHPEISFRIATRPRSALQQRLGAGHEIYSRDSEEMQADRGHTLIMVLDDDRVYPRDALETYLYYSEQLPNAALCFRGAAMPSTLDWDHARMIYGKGLREPRPVSVITECGSYLI
jgi:hypothetical protein